VADVADGTVRADGFFPVAGIDDRRLYDRRGAVYAAPVGFEGSFKPRFMGTSCIAFTVFRECRRVACQNVGWPEIPVI